MRVGADVARDLADLLVRDVDAVVAAEAEQQVVAGDAGDLLRLEAEQLGDAVVLVDDVVAGAEVGEARERATGRARWRAAGGGGRPACRGAARRRARARRSRAARARRRRSGRAARRPGSSISASIRRSSAAPPLGLAAVGEGDDDVEPLAERARRARSRPRRARARRGPAAAPRTRTAGPAGAGRARLAPSSESSGHALVAPDSAHVVGLPDEVGRAGRAAARGRPAASGGVVLVAGDGSVVVARLTSRSAAG